MPTKKRVIKAGIRRGTLAAFYGVDVRVFQEWLEEELGIMHQKTLKPIEICNIIRTFGLPDKDIEVRVPFIKVSVLEQMPIQFDQVA